MELVNAAPYNHLNIVNLQQFFQLKIGKFSYICPITSISVSTLMHLDTCALDSNFNYSFFK